MSSSIVLAGGCFWCLDAAYRQFSGVTDVRACYTGGDAANPRYAQVCTGTTGHAEAVEVIFEDAVLPLAVVLDAFFVMHDPTQLNRQGNDIGTQYRSAMFPADSVQYQECYAARDRAAELWPVPIVTEISPLGAVFLAEEEHQNFFAKNPTQGYCVAVAVPKIQKVRSAFGPYLRDV